MGQGEQLAAGLDRRDEVFGLSHRRGHRLVADDVDAGIQEGAGGRVVQVVGRHDGDGVDAVFAGGFRLGHLGEVGIGAVRCDEEVGGAVAGAFRIAGERAGDQFPAVVQAGGDAVDGADEGAPAAADHAQAQPAPRGAVRELPLIVMAFLPGSQAKHPAVRGVVGTGFGEVVEGAFRDLDDVRRR